MDNQITEETKLVKKLLHLDDASSIVYIDEGWTSRVYIVNDGQFVAKFPRREEVKKEYVQEIAILKLLDDIKSGVLVPKLFLTDANNDYLIYKGIIGESLGTLPVLSDQTIEQTIGANLGRFLKQLHGLKLIGAVSRTVEDQIAQFQNKYETAKNYLSRELTTDENSLLNKWVYSILPERLKAVGYDKALCHGDLGYWNMILSSNNQIGVIDFGDIGYWDRSMDFVGMESTVMLDSALKVYGDNAVLRDKIALRKKIPPLLDLPYYLDKNDKEGIVKTLVKIKLHFLSDNA